MLDINNIYCGDAVDLLKKIDDKTISLIVSSPPYKKSDGFDYDMIYKVFIELFRVLKDDSLFFLVFGHLKEDKFRPFRVCQYALDAGFQLNDTITWIKNHYTPLRGNNLNNLTEFIFMLYKGKMPNINRLSIGIPYSDISNAKRYNNGVNLRCRSNAWFIDIPTVIKSSQKLHKDQFPSELSDCCIKLANLAPNSIVLDPFCGSGTVLSSAKNLGYNFLGIDKNPEYVRISKDRLII